MRGRVRTKERNPEWQVWCPFLVPRRDGWCVSGLLSGKWMISSWSSWNTALTLECFYSSQESINNGVIGREMIFLSFYSFSLHTVACLVELHFEENPSGFVWASGSIVHAEPANTLKDVRDHVFAAKALDAQHCWLLRCPYLSISWARRYYNPWVWLRSLWADP